MSLKNYLTAAAAALFLLAGFASAQDSVPDATGTITTADGSAVSVECANVAPDGATLMCRVVETAEAAATDLVLPAAGRLPAEGSVLAQIMAALPAPQEGVNITPAQLKAAMPCNVTQLRGLKDRDDAGCLMGSGRYWVLVTALDAPLPWSESGETPIWYIVSVSDNETGTSQWYNIGPRPDGTLVIDGEG